MFFKIPLFVSICLTAARVRAASSINFSGNNHCPQGDAKRTSNMLSITWRNAAWTYSEPPLMPSTPSKNNLILAWVRTDGRKYASRPACTSIAIPTLMDKLWWLLPSKWLCMQLQPLHIAWPNSVYCAFLTQCRKAAQPLCSPRATRSSIH